MIEIMGSTEDEAESETDKRLSMVDEALVAGTIANTNGLLVILAKLVAKGVFDRADLQSFSDSYSKPLDHVGMRENELVSQMQDQMEFDARRANAVPERTREGRLKRRWRPASRGRILALCRRLIRLVLLLSVILMPFGMAPAAAARRTRRWPACRWAIVPSRGQDSQSRHRRMHDGVRGGPSRDGCWPRRAAAVAQRRQPWQPRLCVFTDVIPK